MKDVRSFSLSQRREAPFRALARGEGTNSAFTYLHPEKGKHSESEVHQISRVRGSRVEVSGSGLVNSI